MRKRKNTIQNSVNKNSKENGSENTPAMDN